MASVSALLRTAAVILPIALFCADTGAADSKQERNFATHPPRIEKIVARLLPNPLPEGNALLEVTMARDEVLPPQIPIQLEQSKALLRDDGQAGDHAARDRIYSAIVPLDLKALEREQQRLRALRDRHGKLTMPIYQGRKLVKRLVLPESFFRPPLPGEQIPLDWWGFPVGLNPAKTVVIRSTDVVEDPGRTYDPCTATGTPMGKWTFGHLMTQIANEAYTGLDPAEFARQWTLKMLQTQTVNGWNIPAHPFTDKNFDAWPRLPMSKVLDLSKAPFKLLAIVNRVDLRDNHAYGGANAGEARFVFGYHGCPGSASPGLSPRMTVILEYGIHKPGCVSLRNWAQQWTALNDLPLGSAAYNAALEAITDQFSLADAAPTKPNKSAINQIRTNRGPSDSIWELREFRLFGKGPASVNLSQSTVAQTPQSDVQFAAAMGYPNVTALQDYVNANEASILTDDHTVPSSFASVHFLGGSSTRLANPFGWNSASITNREARHKFALQTCNGCHFHETGTDNHPTNDFFHIRPAAPGSTANLSEFMTGIDVPDFFDGMPTRHFNELERRATDLDGVANNVCLKALDTQLGKQIPLRMSH